jgi:ABC-2 type transport system permease protein
MTGIVRALVLGFRFQSRQAVSSPELMQVWVTTPLFTVVILAIAEGLGRGDMAGYAVVAATLMAVVSAALLAAGAMVARERAEGTLEPVIAAPVDFGALVLGRLLAVTSLGAAAFAEAYVTAGAVFGAWINVVRPGLFALAVIMTALGAAAAASVLSPLFVLVSSARTVQNTLTYPLYLVSGVLVPLADLPRWVEPVGRLSVLSWLADLLRAALGVASVDVYGAVAAVALLSLGAVGIQRRLLAAVLRRVREAGTLGWT